MNANDVLHWASAKQTGSWAGYKEALEEMSATADEDADDLGTKGLPAYQRLRLDLERLGHVEFRRHDFPNGWRVVPPVIALISGGTTGILCGARTEELLARVQGAFPVVRITPQPECPDLVELEVPHNLERIAGENGLRIQPHATESLLAALPNIEDRQLRAQCELPFGNDAPVAAFYSDAMQWVPSSPSHVRKAPFGLFRWQLSYEWHYYLKYRGQSYRVPVQVGKYLLLRREHRHVLTFEQGTQSLTIPVAYRPPLLVDCALTLRAGVLPELRNGSLVYTNVTRPIALMTAAILSQ